MTRRPLYLPGALLLYLCLAGNVAPEPKAVVPLTLARVTTWADLRAQPSIPLPGGGWIRLGLRRTSVPVQGGTLLYGLVGGAATRPTPRTLRDGARVLGPVIFRTHFQGGPITRGASLWDTTPQESGEAVEDLYGGALVIASRETLHVEVSLPQGRLLARGRIDPTQTPQHPWMSLQRTDERQRRSRRAGRPAAISLTPTSGSWGIPDVCGLRPIAAWKKKAPPPQGSLPALFPGTPDPTLELEITKDGFTLTSTTGLPWRSIEDRLLYRLWVGGRPLVRPSAAKCECKTGSGPDERAKRIHVRVDWGLTATDADKGAPVELQLLWCPAGWRDGMGLERASVEIDTSNLLPGMTRRR